MRIRQADPLLSATTHGRYTGSVWSVVVLLSIHFAGEAATLAGARAQTKDMKAQECRILSPCLPCHSLTGAWLARHAGALTLLPHLIVEYL